MNTPSSVLVGCFERVVWIKVEGRGSFQNSVGMKDFIMKMILRGQREFVVDLEKCELMDSTFMGTLAGVALRLRELGQGSLQVVNANERNSDLLENLGLDQLFQIFRIGNAAAPTPPDPSELETAKPEKTDHRTQKVTVLSAHEALVEAAPTNAAKFKDVLEFLKQDVASDEES